MFSISLSSLSDSLCRDSKFEVSSATSFLSLSDSRACAASFASSQVSSPPLLFSISATGCRTHSPSPDPCDDESASIAGNRIRPNAPATTSEAILPTALPCAQSPSPMMTPGGGGTCCSSARAASFACTSLFSISSPRPGSLTSFPSLRMCFTG